MLDDVLKWLVGVTGLEPRLLTLTAILIAYVASVYLIAKKKTGVEEQPQPVEFGELVSALDRVERGVETVAKYLINLEQPRFQPRHEYEAFLPPNKHVTGAPPRSHHRPDYGERIAVSPWSQHVKEDKGAKRVRHILSQPREELGESEEDFSLPIPVISLRESTENVIHHEAEPQPEPEEPPKAQPSPVVRETLKRTSRKAGRIP